MCIYRFKASITYPNNSLCFSVLSTATNSHFLQLTLLPHQMSRNFLRLPFHFKYFPQIPFSFNQYRYGHYHRSLYRKYIKYPYRMALKHNNNTISRTHSSSQGLPGLFPCLFITISSIYYKIRIYNI